MLRMRRNKRLLQEMTQYERDLAWVMDNYGDLITQYPDAYVAVLNEKVIGHASGIEELLGTLRRSYAKKMPQILIEFIYREHPNLVL